MRSSVHVKSTLKYCLPIANGLEGAPIKVYVPGHNEIINHVEWRQILGAGLAKTQRFVQVEEAGIAQCIVFDRQLAEDATTMEHAQSLLDGIPKGATTVATDWRGLYFQALSCAQNNWRNRNISLPYIPFVVCCEV
jgi:hypothetical protein